jgi:tRNA threonylcarbamoyladenosine biosynthesis protein TsaE
MFNKVTYKLNSLESTNIFAKFIKKQINKTKYNKFIIFLEGDLGSGKTTFTRMLLAVFGIPESDFEGSPTFTIVNEYRENIFHIDLYRLHSIDELYDSGIYDYFLNNGIFIIEWPEILDFEPNLRIIFRNAGDSSRIVDVYRCKD